MGKKVGEITMEYFLAEKTKQLIRGFFAVQNEVGLGRNEEAYQRAFEIWTHKQVVHESALECIVVAGKFVMTVTAHFESNEFAKSLGLSHMKTLSAPWGVAVNFGIKECQITALRCGNK